MPSKKKAIPGSIQFNKLIAELPKNNHKFNSEMTF